MQTNTLFREFCYLYWVSVVPFQYSFYCFSIKIILLEIHGLYHFFNHQSIRMIREISPVFQGLPWWLSYKESAAMQDTGVWSLGWEDRLEESIATHSVLLLGESPWQRSQAGHSPWGLKASDMNERLSTAPWWSRDSDFAFKWRWCLFDPWLGR